MKSLFEKTDKCHFKKKKPVIVHFQGIVSSRFTAEADKRLVVFEQKTINPF